MNPQGHKMRILPSDVGMCTMNIFEAMHTYMQRAVGSLPERGSITFAALELNFHLPWNDSDWLVKQQGYMVVHPFSSEELRLLWCSRFNAHTDSLCWTDSPETSEECKHKMTKRFYECLQYQMDKGRQGFTGVLSERLDRMAPVTVMDQGIPTDPLCKMMEFHPDIGDLHGRAAKVKDVHNNWKTWFVDNGYSWKHFTGVTAIALCGNDVDWHGNEEEQDAKWTNSLTRDAPLAASEFAKVREGHRVVMGFGNEACW